MQTIQRAGNSHRSGPSTYLRDPMVLGRVIAMSILTACVIVFSISPAMLVALFTLTAMLVTLELATLGMGPLVWAERTVSHD